MSRGKPAHLLEDDSRTAAWSGHRSAEDRRRWQDEISSGFDRLVALASEVDRRKYAGESDQSRYHRTGGTYVGRVATYVDPYDKGRYEITCVLTNLFPLKLFLDL